MDGHVDWNENRCRCRKFNMNMCLFQIDWRTCIQGVCGECLVDMSHTHIGYRARVLVPRVEWRGGGLGSRPEKMYGERLGDGVEYHLMKPTPRR